MKINRIDASMLKNMFLSGAKRLDKNKEYINELNVFPVPDGDTGTNMTMTIMSAAREVSAIDEPTMASLAKAISQGALRGARGNSGVILSQLFRGFTREIKEQTELDGPVLERALRRASETAYKAVMKPKEGTILTVARGISEKAGDILESSSDLTEAFQKIIEHGNYMLSITPEMLPVLKQAGVIDSGGKGLMTVLEGAYAYMIGEDDAQELDTSSATTNGQPVPERKMGLDEIETADIKFGYCTEFIVMLEKKFDDEDEKQFKAYLSSIGDSIVCVADEDIVKVHVHTNDPGLAIQKGLSYGSLTSMKIDNMREEHHERLFKDAEKLAEEQKKEDEKEASAAVPMKETGFVSISVGEGISKIFQDLGVDFVVEGGQTMNPSTADILDAVEKVHAKTVYVMPNNKNIILAAQQAAELAKDCRVVVIPSTNIPQGIAAIINYIEGETPEENSARMIEEMQKIRSAQVTYSIRDTEIDGKQIKEGDIMGIGDKGLLAVGDDIDQTVIDCVKAMADEDTEIISLYHGADVTDESCSALAEKIGQLCPDCDVEVYNGGQPIYYYVISAE